MSNQTSLDLRYPIGLLFVALGVILAVYGALTAGDHTLYARSAGVNLNLVWGGVMIGCGAVFLVMASRRP